jgi:ribonuclease HII
MIESQLLQSGIKNIAGVDEAGRGPCAGPLVIAAVILNDPLSKTFTEVQDSKQLSTEQREILF